MMKKTKTNNLLVLALSETSIVAAQAHWGPGHYQIKHTATYDIPEPLTLAQPEALGHALRAFLRRHGLTAGSVIVGVPAKWIVAKSVTLPPTPPEAVGPVLEIQAEQAFSINHQDLVFGYSARFSATQTNEVLLAAMQKQRLEQIRTLVKAAGLHLAAVTPCAAAVGALASNRVQTCGVFVGDHHCDVAIAKDGVVRRIQHLAGAIHTQDPKGLSADIQRVLLLIGQQGQNGTPMELLIWSDDAQAPDTLKRFMEQAGPGIKVRPIREALVDEGGLRLDQIPQAYDAAAGLILAAGKDSMIDFANTRIGAEKPKRNPRVVFWASVAGLILVLALGALYWNWSLDHREIVQYKQLLADNKETLAEVKALKERVLQASGWYNGREQYLDCLKALAQIFPEQGDVWVKNLNLQDDSLCLITGDAVSRQSVLNVIDAMQRSEHFANVNTHYIHETGKTSKEVSFAVRFQYVK